MLPMMMDSSVNVIPIQHSNVRIHSIYFVTFRRAGDAKKIYNKYEYSIFMARHACTDDKIVK